MAQSSHTPLHILEDWPADKVLYYFNEAVKFTKKQNEAQNAG